MMPHASHLESAARRKLGKSAEWIAYRFECVGPDYLVEGAIPVRFNKKGRPEWAGRGDLCALTKEQVEEEIERYERETGNCRECFGKAETLLRASALEGVTMQPCKKCSGTGKSPTAEKESRP